MSKDIRSENQRKGILIKVHSRKMTEKIQVKRAECECEREKGERKRERDRKRERK